MIIHQKINTAINQLCSKGHKREDLKILVGNEVIKVLHLEAESFINSVSVIRQIHPITGKINNATFQGVKLEKGYNDFKIIIYTEVIFKSDVIELDLVESDFKEQDAYLADIYTILQKGVMSYNQDPKQKPNPMTAAVVEVYHKYKITPTENLFIHESQLNSFIK